MSSFSKSLDQCCGIFEAHSKMGFQKLQYSYLQHSLLQGGWASPILNSPGDCFLLEMAQDGLSFGAALPAARQRGVQDLVSVEMSCLAGVRVEVIWSGIETGPQGNSPLCRIYGLSGSGQVRTREEKHWEPQEMESSPSEPGDLHSLH